MTATVTGAPARPAPRPAPPARERHLRVVPEQARRRSPGLMLGLAGTATAAIFFLVVASHVTMVQSQFELEQLADRRAEAQQRHEDLRRQVAELSSPQAIVEAARAMGLVEPVSVDYIAAPPAAPQGDAEDRTASTLGTSWDEVKASLGADS